MTTTTRGPTSLSGGCRTRGRRSEPCVGKCANPAGQPRATETRSFSTFSKQDPAPAGPWPNELDATNFGAACPQFERTTGRVIGHEDCLFLNVFTPHPGIASNSTSQSLQNKQNKLVIISNQSRIERKQWLQFQLFQFESKRGTSISLADLLPWGGPHNQLTIDSFRRFD